MVFSAHPRGPNIPQSLFFWGSASPLKRQCRRSLVPVELKFLNSPRNMCKRSENVLQGFGGYFISLQYIHKGNIYNYDIWLHCKWVVELCCLLIPKNTLQSKYITYQTAKRNTGTKTDRTSIRKKVKLLYFEWSPPWHVGWRLSGEGCHWEYDGKNGEFENIDFRFPWLSDTSEMGFGHDVPFLNYSDRLPHPSDLCQPDWVRWG